MKARIVPIGKSQGIRIPQPLLDQTGLSGEVDISAQDDTLIIRPLARPRAGWSAALREMARRGDDALLDDDASNPSRSDEG
jgi:antitoxin MazE